MRVLFANNYPMQQARQGWELGTYPANHLFGTAYLPSQGHSVVDLTRDYRSRAPKAEHIVQKIVGDVGQQVRVMAELRRGGKDDVIYAAEATSLQSIVGLGRIRRRVPRVVLAHRVPWRYSKGLLWGASRVVVFARTVRDELVAGGFPAHRVVVYPQGPDLEFPGYLDSSDQGFVVSTGKTKRDHPTLLRALDGTDVEAHLFVPPGSEVEALARTNPRVTALPTTVSRPPGTPLTYDHVIGDLRRAAMLAIPLARMTLPYGMTELNDALALGKPVVMTRSRFIDVDIEAIGCGIWVEPNDVDGWRAAIKRLAADPEARREMGAAGRQWAEANWNARLFAEGVTETLLDSLRDP